MAFVKTEREIALMRIAGKILGRTLAALRNEVTPGVSGLTLDSHARDLIRSFGGEPAFLGYQPYGADRPYPATLCVSINDVVVHGVPSSRRMQEGDLVKLDLGVRVKGYYADAAITVPAGAVSKEAQTLMRATERALVQGIRSARAGKTLGDVGYAIKKVANAYKVSVVKGLTGHGIGSELHEDPVVLNEGFPGKGMVLVAGMTIAIEPMFSLGSPRVVQGEDDGYGTSDGSLSAHFEHTVLIGAKGAEVLTAPIS